MSEEVKKKKVVSHSQFSNWWTCPYKWYRDYILHEKVFEDSIHMSFGTGIHEAIQLYLKTLYTVGEKEAESIDLVPIFVDAFKREVTKKKIIHTKEDFDGFVGDGKAILAEFKDPSNRLYHFPRDKWEWVGVEVQINEDVLNNVNLTARLDLVLREKQSGNIRIVDFKTSGNGWTNNDKEDFTKTSQLVLYKAVYSKKYNVPLSNIHVEFFILKRKLYAKARYAQSRLQIFKPSSYQKDVLQVIQEFGKFVTSCFTAEGVHNTTAKYPKNPGKNKKNCKYCIYLKNGKCNGLAEPLE
jgi:hypothetical protein